MIALIEYVSYALMPVLIIVVISLSIKNKVSIYDTLFRPEVLHFYIFAPEP